MDTKSLTVSELNEGLSRATWLLGTVLDMPCGNDAGCAAMIARFIYFAGLRYGEDNLRGLVAHEARRYERYQNGLCIFCSKPWTGKDPYCDACDQAARRDANYGFSGKIVLW
jgi:hypothetical protein